ncbi:MAG: hypothetical protein JWO82_3279 [Akkermansiaceae bacterium]|nr:hypothetical protein [Akkermansiaceae bacterium]
MARENQSAVFDADAWARRTASRLRLIHSSFADQGFDQKRTYLEDEIEFALDDAGAVSESQKRDLLDRLAGCFPVYSETGGSAVAAPVAASSSPQAKVDPLDALMEEWSRAGQERRDQITRTLASAGIVPVPAAGGALALEIAERVTMPVRPEQIDDFVRGLDQLWKELGGEGGTADFNRLFKLLGMLAAAMRDLHKFLWEFWRQSAPRELQANYASGFHEPFERMVAGYLRSDEQCSSRDLAVEIEKTKRLMLGVCVAVRKGAEEFGRSHYQTFAPENIENAVVIEETATDRAKVRDLGRKAWEKYSTLSKHMTPDSIDQEFQRAFAGVMTAWLRSRS